MLHERGKLRQSLVLAASLIAALALSGCETASKAWRSTTDTVGGLFSSDDEEAEQTADGSSAEGAASSAAGEGESAAAPAPAPGELTTGTMPGAGPSSGRFVGAATSTRAPNLADVPTEAPVPPSTQAEREEAKEGLIADRERAQYSDQPGRREPVTVRPLSAGAQTAPATPPVPQAAPTQSVTRIETPPPAAAPARAAAQTGVQTAAVAPAAPSEPVAPRTTALAERLGATPPPPPPPEGGAAPAPQALRPSTPPAAATSTQTGPLVPTMPRANPYGDDTVVIDGSGVRGGMSAPQQMATALVAPRAGFDPGNASVSSQIGTIAFTPGSNALNGAARAVLKDVAELRKSVDGAVRVEVHGPANADRTAAIAAELRRLGVPAARLYTGGGMMVGDEADIYLDY